MRTVIMLVAVAALGAGIRVGAPRPATVALLQASYEEALPTSRPRATALLPRAGTAESLLWESSTPGMGAGSVELSLTAGGNALCTLFVDCTQTEPAVEPCEAGAFAAGATLRLQVASQSCDEAPLGHATATLLVQ